MTNLFTSESVCQGHPDKVCDQIADAILDAHLAQDPFARVACEVTAAANQVHILGEVTSSAQVDYEAIARSTIASIGYIWPELNFDSENCQIRVDLHRQSPDIARGVLKQDPLENGAGDQGIMFGYACTETEHYMPLAIELANRMTRQLDTVRKQCASPVLMPDGKGQVTVEYQDGQPVRIDTVVLSAQHREDISQPELEQLLTEQVIRQALPQHLMDRQTKIYINPTGRFVVGGPAGDSGLTGRKIIADTYGGYARHGGGAFSGKDPTKVDRSAAYMARYLAKNVVAMGWADRCEVQLSYAIGQTQPVSVHLDTFGTRRLPEKQILQELRSHNDLSPSGIIRAFDLRRPIYSRLSCYGHFGENAADMPWEAIHRK